MRAQHACISLASLHPVMAPVSHSLKTAAKAVTVFVLFFAFVALLPYILLTPAETYPQAHAFALSFVWVAVWVAEKFLQGAAVFSLIAALATLCTVLHDVYGWLTGRATAASTTPTPADLENGGAPGLDDVAALEAEVTVAEPPAPAASPPKPKPSAVRRIVNSALFIFYFVYIFLSLNVVSLDKPLLENIGATSVFILNGLEVDFVFFLLAAVAGCCMRRGPRAAATAPVLPTAVSATVAEVVFDEAAPATKEEKEYKDVVAEEKA
ncbi:hypothetical protein B0H11DRAFT_1928611 [Mycena galericulata]|nr:hypothetical protein B0H11DRAFT_1928611 [Mycena galericulata]